MSRGVTARLGRSRPDQSSVGPPTLVAWLTGLTVLVSIGSVLHRPQIRSFNMNEVAARVVAANSPNPLVLVCATSDAEGGAIAAFTALERHPYHSIVRGTQALSSNKFMETGYETQFITPDQLNQWLIEHQIGWLVVETSRESLAWTHNKVAVDLRDHAQTGWSQIRSFSQADGVVQLDALPAAHRIPDDIAKSLWTTHPGTLTRDRTTASDE